MGIKETTEAYLKVLNQAIKKIKQDQDSDFKPQEFEPLLKSVNQHKAYITDKILNADKESFSKVLTEDEIRDTKESIINYLDEELTKKGKGEWRRYIEVYFDSKYKEFKIGTTATGKRVFDIQSSEGSYSRYCFNIGKALIIEFFENNNNEKFYNCIPNNKN